MEKVVEAIQRVVMLETWSFVGIRGTKQRRLYPDMLLHEIIMIQNITEVLSHRTVGMSQHHQNRWKKTILKLVYVL